MLLVAAALAGLLAVRVAAVAAFVERRPELAAAIWPDHPAVVMARGMAEIGDAAASGRQPSPEVTGRLRDVATRDPLSAGAPLVAGAEAFASGDLRSAERLLSLAVARDPYAPAPRFLLTDLYLRQGRGKEGFDQLSTLVRRLGPSASPLVPALAQFARQPGGPERLEPLLGSSPELRDQLLDLLAADPANLPAILQLAGPATNSTPEWQAKLLAAMVAAGDYRRAYDLWQRLNGISPLDTLIFNPRFLASGPPPPFNWRLTSGSAGLAEAQPGGGLRVLYYGREDANLAEQLLLLAPGRYRLRQDASGPAINLGWSVVCLPSGKRQDATEFALPANCPAQRLELRGTLAETAATTDLLIRSLSLSPVSGR